MGLSGIAAHAGVRGDPGSAAGMTGGRADGVPVRLYPTSVFTAVP
jgi:hypothetical protein